jgi:hypothetical protein
MTRKDLKVKGSPTSIKVGTKVHGIKIVTSAGDHDIDCEVDGFEPISGSTSRTFASQPRTQISVELPLFFHCWPSLLAVDLPNPTTT